MGVVGDATVIRLRLSSDGVVDELYYSSVSGYILDGDDAGVVNAVVELTGDDYDAKVTDSNGYYQFPEVLNGNYTLTPTKNGKTYYADHQDIAVAGADVLVDTMIEVWVVSGYIVDSVDAGIEGVTVTLSGDESGSTTTDANGFYTFSNIPNGSYTVTPAKADLEFTPDHQDITVVDADEVVTDMVGDSIHYTISGYILDGDS
ncbi:MAG TPA: carboxypeptidase regulatory-like domain-containing protein, partial [Armatimonadota bacterium]|nr:carboxypeptidase regulatory-like domain-containing protein [Armatimonadota bacterium]